MFRNTVSRVALCATLAGVAGWALPAHAQTSEDRAPVAQAADDAASGDIIVTARAGAEAQKKVDASYAISTVSEQELQMRAPVGVGEALKNVPGLWIENSSGEASGNIRVRGIPNDGYSTVGLLEDGIPVQADAGLGWLNADQSLRVDQTVQRIEVVRGGPASIFYSNAPGAVINFITRRGGDHLEGLVRYEWADYNSNRVDGWIGGPIGDSDWRFFTGGYYRLSDGQRHTGWRQDEGGQIRANISREFDRGSVTFGVKRIDERIGNAAGGIFVTSADGDPVGVTGFDVKKDSIAGPDTRYFSFPTADGSYQFDDATGTKVKLTQLSFDADYKLTDAITIQQRNRYRDSWTRRTSITPYSVASASDLLSSTYGAYVGAGQSLALYYRDSGAAFDLANQNGNGLALVNLARSYTVPLKEFINDTRFVADADWGGHHNLALGFYYAHEDEKYNVNSAAVLTDVKNQAEVLDAYLVDAAGNKLYQFTDNGVMQYGAEWANSYGTSDTLAIYGSDEWQITDKFRLDGGARWEQIEIRGGVEGKTKATISGNTTGANTYYVGTGVFTPFSHTYEHAAWTVGGNYQFQPDFGFFLRYTDTFRLPNISNFITNAAATPVTQKMNFLEAGLKFERPKFSAYLTGFRTIYESYEIDDYIEQSDGTFVANTYYGDTKTWGTELEATWRPVSWFDLHALWTWQDARFTDFVYTNSSGASFDYSHNRLIRVPENSFRVTPALNLLGKRLRVETDIGYYGQRWADVANDVNLPAYWQVDLNARFNVTDRLQLNVIAQNLFDEIGLSNGNPRAGTIQNGEAGDSVYIGSSVYGRNVRAAVTFRF